MKRVLFVVLMAVGLSACAGFSQPPAQASLRDCQAHPYTCANPPWVR